MDNFSIAFNSKYKGHIKDLIKYKISSFFSTILISIIIFFIGAYVSYIDYNRVINTIEFIFGNILIVISVIFLFISPFVLIFINYNHSLKGEIRINFIFQDNKINYSIYTNKHNKSYDESGVVVSLLRKKNFLILSNEKAKEYFISLNALSEFDKNKLIDLSNNFKNIINNK